MPIRYDPTRHHRRSIRLQGYDYSQAGAYFVTICTQNRAFLFGEIADGRMVLNDAGRMVKTVWDEIPQYYPGIDIDACQIMPNHIHGIIILVGAGPRACPVTPGPRACPMITGPVPAPQPQRPTPTARSWGQSRNTTGAGLSLPDVVHRFKTMTTKRYIDGVKQYGWPRFNARLWQRNYWEHVVRHENELNRIRRYIMANPAKWASDRINPDGAGSSGVAEPQSQYGHESWMV